MSIIGAMSGSSLDGLDIALCTFQQTQDSISWALQQYKTIEFPTELRKRLVNAYQDSAFDLMQLDADFGAFIGRGVQNFLTENKLSADYIASHGHTVFHEPSLGFSTQIGSGAHITNTCGITTITNFRSADLVMQGQGAPFAPVADTVLFPGYNAYINLGGIANIHFTDIDGQSHARDIGPCNQVLNFLAGRLNIPYDKNGANASKGTSNPHIVRDLISMFSGDEGKPLGLSNAQVRTTWIKYLASREEDTTHLLASVTEAIAILLTQNLAALQPRASRILVTGGGAYNTFLLNRIRARNESYPFQFEVPAAEIVEYKECALMAYLGFLTVLGKPYPLKHITGALANSIGGAIHKATG